MIDSLTAQLGVGALVALILLGGIKWMAGQLEKMQAARAQAQDELVKQCREALSNCAAERQEIEVRFGKLQDDVRKELTTCMQANSHAFAEQSQALRMMISKLSGG